MIEILWIGRGGQGAFTAAKLLGASASASASSSTSAIINADSSKTYYALSFPSFGPERRGAPVRAFTKLDFKPVSDRSETEKADFIVILDETLYSPELSESLKENGKILVNSKNKFNHNTLSFDGTQIAKELRLPTTNTLMMGFLAKTSKLVSLPQLEKAIEEYMPAKIQEKNKKAVSMAFSAREDT